jgi:hypothetical protein
MASVEFDPQPLQAYATLEKAVATRLLDGIDAALDVLETNSGDSQVRRRSFGDGLWGVPVRDEHEDWLLIWEYDPESADTVVVRYLGVDPFG